MTRPRRAPGRARSDTAALARRAWGYLWAAPWTVFGLVLTPLVLLTGGRARIVAGVLELGGGLLRWLLPRLGLRGSIVAMTLGHTVVAVDQDALHHTRAHERVHVAQFERWGPLFPLLYAGASLAARLRGRHYYLDNRFEREARDRAN